MKKTCAVMLTLSLMSPVAYAGWGDVLNAAANIATQKSGNSQTTAALALTQNQYEALAANPSTIQQNIAQALALQAQANGQILTPQQQQALAAAYAQSAANSKGQTTQLTADQQKLLIQQGLTPAQVQAYAQLQGVNPAQLQALAQSHAAQVEGAPCQPVANPKSSGMGGLFGKVAGSALRSGLVPGMSAEAAATAANVAESAGAMADCVPATK